jgi:hypothetical protein
MWGQPPRLSRRAERGGAFAETAKLRYHLHPMNVRQMS